jgi:hypothetical protein
MVEQQERRKLGMTPVVEHCMDREAVADPVPFGLAMDAEEFFHASSMGTHPFGIKYLYTHR